MREIAHDALADLRMPLAEDLKPVERQFHALHGGIGPDVGRAMRFHQRHFAEGLAGNERRQPQAVGALHAHHAALQEEERAGSFAARDDLLAGMEAPQQRKLADLIDQVLRQAGEQFLFGEVRGVEQMREAAEAENDLVFRPFDRFIERGEVAQPGFLG
jgi:hypothetical protein